MQKVKKVLWPEPKTEDLEWAEMIGKKFHKKLPRFVPIDDVIQEARLGLIDAMRRYKKKKGEFRKFASPRIWGQIHDWLRTHDNARRKERYNLKFIPFSALTSASYRNTFDHDAHASFVYVKDNPLEVMTHRDEFEHLIEKLDTVSRDIMRFYYRDSLTMREIAIKLGLSESRVSQVHSEALSILQLKRVGIKRRGKWHECYERARKYLLEHNEIPSERGPDCRIAQWIRTQRKRARRDELHPLQMELLTDLPLWYH